MPNATYHEPEGHAEAVEIVFDPERISYRDILEFFFQIHDPTTMNRQGNDIGSSYRSEIFHTSDEQRQVAEETIADVEASGLWPGKVVTAVSEAGTFWEAEPEHQDYLQKYPDGYTCHFVRPTGSCLAANRPRSPHPEGSDPVYKGGLTPFGRLTGSDPLRVRGVGTRQSGGRPCPVLRRGGPLQRAAAGAARHRHLRLGQRAVRSGRGTKVSEGTGSTPPVDSARSLGA